MKKIFRENIKIISNNKINKNYFKLILESFQITSIAQPGQFVEIKVNNNNSNEPFLRRPFSIHGVKNKDIEILYEAVGRGTEILSQKKSGEYLDVIGPLGNGFDYQSTVHNVQQSTVMVAGGMGVAPLVFLAEKLKQRKMQNIRSKTLVLIGAKTKSQILCEKEFKELGCDVRISTDDGSKGFKGKVTKLLRHLLSTTNYELPTIYACGPRPMLEEITHISQRYKIPAQVSLEEHMACGIGACLGCVVKTRDGFKRVCKEGPVFETQELVW